MPWSTEQVHTVEAHSANNADYLPQQLNILLNFFFGGVETIVETTTYATWNQPIAVYWEQNRWWADPLIVLILCPSTHQKIPPLERLNLKNKHANIRVCGPHRGWQQSQSCGPTLPANSLTKYWLRTSCHMTAKFSQHAQRCALKTGYNCWGRRAFVKVCFWEIRLFVCCCVISYSCQC